jgi:hypothetical protein
MKSPWQVNATPRSVQFLDSPIFCSSSAIVGARPKLQCHPASFVFGHNNAVARTFPSQCTLSLANCSRFATLRQFGIHEETGSLPWPTRAAQQKKSLASE